MQIENVREAIRCDAQGIASTRMGTDLFVIMNIRNQDLRVVVRRYPNKHPRVRPTDLVSGQPSVFQGFPGNLQQDSLLRIDLHRFAGRDTKKLRIELLNVVQQCGPANRNLSRLFPGRIVELIEIPPRRGNLDNPIATKVNQSPKRSEIWRSRKSTCHTDDGDRLGAARLLVALPLCKSSLQELALGRR